MHIKKKASDEQLQVVPPEPIEIDLIEPTRTRTPTPTPIPSKKDELPRQSYLTRTVGLLRTVQRWSTIPILAFAAVHLTSVVIVPAIGGPEAGDAAISISRDMYQTPVGEGILALSTAIHFGAGIALQITRRIFAAKHHGKKWWRLSFQPVRLSGWILSGLLAGHVWRLRWAPLSVDGDSSLVDYSGYLSWLLAAEPLATWAGLTLLIASTVFHIGAALPQVLHSLSAPSLGPRGNPRAVRRALLLLTAAAALALARTAWASSWSWSSSPRAFPAPLARRYALYAAW